MSLRAVDATTTELCLRLPPKSTERCQFSRVLTHHSQIVICVFTPTLCALADFVLSSAGPLASRSKLGRDEIKWQELLLHFRSVQAKHEKARRLALGADTTPFSGFSATGEKPADPSLGQGRPPSSAASRPAMRRKVTGGELPNITVPPRNILSPLNPRSRGQGIIPSAVNPQSPTSMQAQAQGSRPPRTVSVNKKV